jgi:hypothetical protein
LTQALYASPHDTIGVLRDVVIIAADPEPGL